MDNTIILQGRFTSGGTRKQLALRSDVDWMHVINETEFAASNNGHGFEYKWYRGRGTAGLMYYHPAGDHTVAVNTVASAFSLVDTGTPSFGAVNATITAISNDAIPIVSAGSTTGVSSGSVVRFGTVTNATQVGGFDCEVDTVVVDTSFRLKWMAQLADAGTNGSYKTVDVSRTFYPKARYITKITQADPCVITMSVTHDFVVGDKVKIKLWPQVNAGASVWGMPEIADKEVKVTAVSTANNTITVDLDSTGYTAFTFGSSGDRAATHALRFPQVIPVGPGIIVPVADRAGYYGTTNPQSHEAAIKMFLSSGTTGPAGSTGDVIYWTAGKSFSVLDEI